LTAYGANGKKNGRFDRMIRIEPMKRIAP
jgi:hypothetical protein